MKKQILLVLLLIIGIVPVFFCFWKNESHLKFKDIYENPVYTNPPYQDVDLNNINIIIPVEPEKKSADGEYFMGQQLAQYFRSQHKNVKIITDVDYYEEKKFISLGGAVNIYLYGGRSFYPNKSGINIVYLLYPEILTNSNPFFDMHSYDFILTGSRRYAHKLTEQGYNAMFLPQFTDNSRFYYEKSEKYSSTFLYVANCYKGIRTTVEYALKENITLDVYGRNWNKYLDASQIKGTFIDNKELHKYYSSAKIVLNDHRPDMLHNGFISNRIYDVTASGGFLISDYMPEIEEIYGDSIPMYKNSQEFGELVRFYLAHPELRAEKAAKAHKITMENFTLDKIGEKILKAAEDIYKVKKVDTASTYTTEKLPQAPK